MFTLPGASHTCHLQTSPSKCFTLFKELCSPSTHGGVDGGSAERQLRSCLWTKCRGGARGRHTRRSWQRFLTRRQRSIFGVREANLESEKHIWIQGSIFLESEKHSSSQKSSVSFLSRARKACHTFESWIRLKFPDFRKKSPEIFEKKNSSQLFVGFVFFQSSYPVPFKIVPNIYF